MLGEHSVSVTVGQHEVSMTFGEVGVTPTIGKHRVSLRLFGKLRVSLRSVLLVNTE